MILNAIVENKKRFAEWASEWLTIPPQMFNNGLLKSEDEDYIIEMLINYGVFTVQEIKSELKRHKIFYSNRLFKKYKGA